MLRTDILCVGKIKEESVRALIAEYSKRLGAYTTLRIVEVKDEKTPDNCSDAEREKILKTEGDRLAEYLEDRSCKIVLAVEGKQLSSEAFADYINEAGLQDEAVKLMKEYWGKMISLGADTFWEAFDPDRPGYSPYGSPIVNSYCHAWSCTPVYLIKKYL